MEKEKLTISIVKANLFSLLLFVILIAAFFPLFFAIWKFDKTQIGFGPFWFLIAMIIGIPVHELIHGITWAYFAPNGWKSISFGMIWKMLTPYCHCNEPMKVNQYRWGALMPLIVLGVIPLTVAFLIGNMIVLFFGIVFIVAASGDIMCCWVLRHESKDTLVEDHPSEAGCWVYHDTDTLESNTND